MGQPAVSQTGPTEAHHILEGISGGRDGCGRREGRPEPETRAGKRGVIDSDMVRANIDTYVSTQLMSGLTFARHSCGIRSCR